MTGTGAMCLRTVLDCVQVVKLVRLERPLLLLSLTCFFSLWPLHTLPRDAFCIAEPQSAGREPFPFIHRPRPVIYQS
jgi:hypothetical protein